MMSMIRILIFATLLLVAVNGQSSESSASSEESSEEKSNESKSSEESSEEMQRMNNTKTMIDPHHHGYNIEKQNLIEGNEQWNGHFNFKTSEVEVGTPCAGNYGECKHWCLTTQRKVTNDCGEYKFCCIMEH